MLVVASSIALIRQPLCSAFVSRLHFVSSPSFPRKLSTSTASFGRFVQRTYVASPAISIVENMEFEEEDRPILAKRVQPSALSLCGARLRDGNLVAFPTETVYGLGCNALNSSAIRKVFQAKERPLTDPLIVHVNDSKEAFALWNAGDTTIEGKTLIALTSQFWPGPLTLVAKAQSHVPDTLMANTGFVACRSPSHPMARALIQEAQVPLAAPSANKFGHVSPTRSTHVWDDLLHEDVWILEASDDTASTTNGDSVCNVGVESTVAKVEITAGSDSGTVTLLRQGAISVADIEQCLQSAGLSDSMVVQAHTKQVMEDHVATVAPGQTIRHYSPRIPSFIVTQKRYEQPPITSPNDQAYLEKAIIIDFGGKLALFKTYGLAYRDLSESNDSSEAARLVFDTLRWAEQVEGADRILFPQILEDPSNASTDALSLAVVDRLTRAASGEMIDTLA